MNLEQLGWNFARAAQLAERLTPDLCPARVAREDRVGYVLYGSGHACRAELSGALRNRTLSKADLPAVGDWVAIRPRDGGQRATIHAVLPRSSAFERRAAGARNEPQVVAANIDTLLICTGLDEDFNPRRVERYLAIAYGSGATPVVLLTKADACDSVTGRVAQIADVAAGARVVAVSVVDGRGVAEVRALLPGGQTAALVGSSGVGKSSLINAFLGSEELATGAVRASDGRGRHTTTHRQLMLLPGGGVIIDTPGMRELQLWGDATDLSSGFADIEGLAGACRFRDCGHRSEPGCAVRGAVECGELDADRLASFHKLQRELRWIASQDDCQLRAAEKARWKTIHKAARRHMREKYGE